MAKIIKEIIIILLICLITMLIFAVVLYDYIPNRKIVAEVAQYATSEEIEVQLADDIDSEEKEVVLTYEVTSKDLTSYEVANEYIPGKADPFAAVTQSVDGEIDGNTSDTDDNTQGNVIENTTVDENISDTNSLVDDGGIK